jgi:calcineurin-like phosphoesterase family protein
MNNTWVTADQHFGHKGIIHFLNRPFKSTDEMDEVLIVNWNAKVGENDLVYVLGDMIWVGDAKQILDKLKGKIIYIPSLEWTHEKIVLECRDRFEKVSPLLTIKAIRTYGIYITLCHYCMRTWPKSHYNSWHLFAHSHGRLEAIGKSQDVGVDTHNFFPYSLDEITAIMKGRPDNPGYLRIQRKL